jgi:chorismate mutase
MAVRGIRGATTTEDDSAEAILEATTDLLTQIAAENQLEPQQIAGAWFTTTIDLTAEFPATAARRLGWTHVPLLCAHEMQVPASNARSIPRCIRVMLLVNTERTSSDMRFVYLRSARNLRDTP